MLRESRADGIDDRRLGENGGGKHEISPEGAKEISPRRKPWESECV
jgi:hypothetical protein